jgi:transcription elongation factor GreB
MSSLEVVDPADQDPGRVLFGAQVTISEKEAGEQAYRIVGVEESDPAQGRLSWISPVARALIGSRVGDVVNLELPGGRRVLKVLSIEYPVS